MDNIDRNICTIVQNDGRASSAEIAEAVGVSISTANERVRRLVSQGTIRGWRGQLNPKTVGAGLCAFILIDMAYEGETEACELLISRDEVMELHHISGAHSYMAKIRVKDAHALQYFLAKVLKPIGAIQKTETILSLEALKETGTMLIASMGSNQRDA
jgi:Lrp/AsnC family leucine-responsive transcriptional regulator